MSYKRTYDEDGHDATPSIDEELIGLLLAKENKFSYFYKARFIPSVRFVAKPASTSDPTYPAYQAFVASGYKGRLASNDRLHRGINGRVHWIRQPQEEAYPSVILTWLSGAERVEAMGIDPGESERMLQVSVFAAAGSASSEGYLKVIQMADYIRKILERFPLGEVSASGKKAYEGNIHAIFYKNQFTHYNAKLKAFSSALEFRVHSYEAPSETETYQVGMFQTSYVGTDEGVVVGGNTQIDSMAPVISQTEVYTLATAPDGFYRYDYATRTFSGRTDPSTALFTGAFAVAVLKTVDSSSITTWYVATKTAVLSAPDFTGSWVYVITSMLQWSVGEKSLIFAANDPTNTAYFYGIGQDTHKLLKIEYATGTATVLFPSLANFGLGTNPHRFISITWFGGGLWAIRTIRESGEDRDVLGTISLTTGVWMKATHDPDFGVKGLTKLYTLFARGDQLYMMGQIGGTPHIILLASVRT